MIKNFDLRKLTLFVVWWISIYPPLTMTGLSLALLLQGGGLRRETNHGWLGASLWQDVRRGEVRLVCLLTRAGLLLWSQVWVQRWVVSPSYVPNLATTFTVMGRCVLLFGWCLSSAWCLRVPGVWMSSWSLFVVFVCLSTDLCWCIYWSEKGLEKNTFPQGKFALSSS